MIEKEIILKFVDECLFYQGEGCNLNFLEIIKLKIKEGHFDVEHHGEHGDKTCLK